MKRNVAAENGLKAAIRDHRDHDTSDDRSVVTTGRGETIGLGDKVATRRNDSDLGVANRQTWTVADIGEDGTLVVHGQERDRVLPADYVRSHVELAFATTVHGAQGETVTAAQVAMTRGRDTNTAHLVADNLDDARRQWIELFGPGRPRTRGVAHVSNGGSTAERFSERATPLHSKDHPMAVAYFNSDTLNGSPTPLCWTSLQGSGVAPDATPMLPVGRRWRTPMPARADGPRRSTTGRTP